MDRRYIKQVLKVFFGVCLLLSIAYGASLGGILTLIGTPPNGIFVRFGNVELSHDELLSMVEREH